MSGESPSWTAEPCVEAAVLSHLRSRMVYFSRMNKSDLKEIKDIVDSALGTHLASVHEEITDLRRDMDARFAEVDARFTAVEGGMDRLE